MFGKIIYIGESEAHVENLIKDANTADLMNVNVVFEDNNQRILGEVQELNSDIIKIRFLGEYINGKYINGVLRKPLLSSKIRMITKDELTELVGTYNASSFILGESAIYKGFNIHPSINSLFSNHLEWLELSKIYFHQYIKYNIMLISLYLMHSENIKMPLVN